MNRKVSKIVFAIIIMILVISNSSIVFAETVAGMPISNNTNQNIMNFGEIILGLAQIIGVGVAVIMLVVLAIKYIVSAPGDKAEIKKHAVVYVVGAIFIFASAGILQIIKVFAESF